MEVVTIMDWQVPILWLDKMCMALEWLVLVMTGLCIGFILGAQYGWDVARDCEVTNDRA